MSRVRHLGVWALVLALGGSSFAGTCEALCAGQATGHHDAQPAAIHAGHAGHSDAALTAAATATMQSGACDRLARPADQIAAAAPKEQRSSTPANVAVASGGAEELNLAASPSPPVPVLPSSPNAPSDLCLRI